MYSVLLLCPVRPKKEIGVGCDALDGSSAAAENPTCRHASSGAAASASQLSMIKRVPCSRHSSEPSTHRFSASAVFSRCGGALSTDCFAQSPYGPVGLPTGSQTAKPDSELLFGWFKRSAFQFIFMSFTAYDG